MCGQDAHTTAAGTAALRLLSGDRDRPPAEKVNDTCQDICILDFPVAKYHSIVSLPGGNPRVVNVFHSGRASKGEFLSDNELNQIRAEAEGGGSRGRFPARMSAAVRGESMHL